MCVNKVSTAVRLVGVGIPMQQLYKNSYTCLIGLRAYTQLNDLLFIYLQLNQRSILKPQSSVHFHIHCDKYSCTAVSVTPPPPGPLMPSMPSLYTHALFRFRVLVSDTASERSALLDVTSRRRRE